MIMFVLLVSKATQKFMANQIVIKLSKTQHSVEEIPFPAVTICPDPKIPNDIEEIIKSLSANSSEYE
jgi:anthranilate/para-aminobenzoate synthase component II